MNEQQTAKLEEETSEAWRNRQFALLHALRVEYARNGRGPKNDTTSRHAQSGTERTGLEKWRNLHPKAVWGARSWTGKRTTETVPRGGNEELPDDLNVAIAVAQDKAAILRYARKAPQRRACPAWRIPAEALLLISDRQCNIETPDTTTDKYLKAQARWLRTERADSQRQMQSTRNTATRQENQVRMSAEQEVEMLERQEEEFQEAFDGSEEDVFGHGVAWDEEENVDETPDT